MGLVSRIWTALKSLSRTEFARQVEELSPSEEVFHQIYDRRDRALGVFSPDGPDEYAPGELIGGLHRVLEVLRGGMGVVYVCERPASDGLLVLKTFQDRFMRDAYVREAFETEALLNVRFGWHPNTVTANSVEVLDGRPFIDMLYVEPDALGRRSLEDHLSCLSADEAFETGAACKIALDICCGMEHAIREGLSCHQDLKPSNILITDHAAKVGDFGLARPIGGASPSLIDGAGSRADGPLPTVVSTNGRRVVGTPPWMSPEHFNGTVDERSDVYALGIILYQLVTGSHPYEGPDWESAHRSAPVPSCSSPLNEVIQRALCKQPADRYSSFAAMRSDLEAVFRATTGKEYESADEQLERMGFHRSPFGGWSHANSGPTQARNLALTLHSLGRSEEAEFVLRRAIDEGERSNPGLLRVLGLIQRRLGGINESRKTLEAAVQLAPDDALLNHDLGTTFILAGDPKGALPYLQQALEQNPCPAVVANTALCLYKLARYDEALDCLAEALDAAPRDPRTWVLKAQLEIALGDGDEAMRSVERARRLASSNDILSACSQLEREIVISKSELPHEYRSRYPNVVGHSERNPPSAYRAEFPITMSPERERDMVAAVLGGSSPSKAITTEEIALAVCADPGAPEWAMDRSFEAELEELLQHDVVWLCPDCDGVVSFHNIPGGVAGSSWVGEFSRVQSKLGLSCPVCKSSRATFFAPKVLRLGSKVDYEQFLGEG